jgi:hypothetical protein
MARDLLSAESRGEWRGERSALFYLSVLVVRKTKSR